MEALYFLEFLGPVGIIVWALILGFSAFMIWTIHRHYSRKDLAPGPCRSCGFMITEHICPHCGRDQTSYFA